MPVKLKLERRTAPGRWPLWLVVLALLAAVAMLWLFLILLGVVSQTTG